ncbi:MAG: SCO family protein [Actinomycetota bacterium]|nr:SCO family protein [Actinomycetota bacterium]
MPPDGPLPDLSPQLFSLLLRSAALLSIAALAVGVVAAHFGRRDRTALKRLHAVLFGAAEDGRSEPSARRFVRTCFGLLWIIDGLLQAQRQMPAAFISRVITPGLDSSPPWLVDAVQPLARMWTRHPVAADAVTVWIQVGLGVLILVGGRGILSRVSLSLSVAWSLWVWVVGEFLGGLLAPGASWLTGAPGAILVYALAGALLLAPWQWWETGRCARFVRRAVGGWILVGAGLQALPWEGSWAADGLSQPFLSGANTAQPRMLRRPIATIATWSVSHPAIVNAVLIVLLLCVGVGLCVSARSQFVIAGVALCAATWWLAQDFGVLGGTGTDPNAALPLGLLLAAAWPEWSLSTEQQSRAEPASSVWARRPRWLREPLGVAIAALGVGALFAAPLLVTGLLLGPADATAVAADSNGGVVRLAHRPAPAFTLTDQNGLPVSMEGLRGKLTLLTFLDPVCSDECPVIANQLAIANAEIGSLTERVEFVAIDTNPVFHNIADVAAFTSSHGLGNMPNWHFLAGPADRLRDVLASYGVSVAVPTAGMIEHSEGIYFISADGDVVAYLGDGANSDLTIGYGHQLRDEIRKLAK